MNAQEWDRTYLWHFRARLIRLHDADTIVCLTDNGMYGRHETHVRIAGLQEPELSTQAGRDLRDLLALALQELLPPPQAEWQLRVVTRQKETIVSEVTSFERYVGDVYVVAPGGVLVDLKELLA